MFPGLPSHRNCQPNERSPTPFNLSSLIGQSFSSLLGMPTLLETAVAILRQSVCSIIHDGTGRSTAPFADYLPSRSRFTLTRPRFSLTRPRFSLTLHVFCPKPLAIWLYDIYSRSSPVLSSAEISSIGLMMICSKPGTLQARLTKELDFIRTMGKRSSAMPLFGCRRSDMRFLKLPVASNDIFTDHYLGTSPCTSHFKL